MQPANYEGDALRVIGQRIRSLRTEQNLSQAQLADSLGISARYLGEVEAGRRNMSFGILYALADRLAIPLHELLNLTNFQDRGETIGQIINCLEKMPLDDLLFLQRAIRMFMRQWPSERTMRGNVAR